MFTPEKYVPSVGMNIRLSMPKAMPKDSARKKTQPIIVANIIPACCAIRGAASH